MVVKNCDRCGQKIKVEKIKDLKEIKCSHCNKEYTASDTTRYWSMAIVAIGTFLLAFIIAVIAEIIKIPPIWLSVPLVIISYYTFTYSYYLLYKTNKLKYDAID